jgi:hypothetical protein
VSGIKKWLEILVLVSMVPEVVGVSGIKKGLEILVLGPEVGVLSFHGLMYMLVIKLEGVLLLKVVLLISSFMMMFVSLRVAPEVK